MFTWHQLRLPRAALPGLPLGMCYRVVGDFQLQPVGERIQEPGPAEKWSVGLGWQSSAGKQWAIDLAKAKTNPCGTANSRRQAAPRQVPASG